MISYGTYVIIMLSMNLIMLNAGEGILRNYIILLLGNVTQEAQTEDLDPVENEEDWARNFLSGSPDTFEKIVVKYRKLIYFAAYHILRSSESAMDATQEVFVKVYKSLSSFKGQSKLRTWIYRIAVNHCLNLLRSQYRRKDTIALDERIEVADSNKTNPRTDLENAELKEKIEWALEQLPDKQRVIFALRNFNDLTFDEIAESLDRSVGGVKANYFHAVRKMRDLLTEKGV